MLMIRRLLKTLLIMMALSPQAQAWLSQTPMLAPDLQGYAKAASCQSCHQMEWHQWQGSHHAGSMRKADLQSVLGNFNNATFDDPAAGVHARFFHRGSEFYVNTEGADGKRADFHVLYTFGFSPLQQYLVAFPGGRLQSLTIAWDSRPKSKGGQRWYSLYPGQRFSLSDPLRWTGHGHNWNGVCADCHSTDLQKNYDDKTDTFATTWKEQSVGCQSCHGPGQAHVDWAHRQKDGGKTGTSYPGGARAMGLDVDFATMGSHQIVDQCARCHSRRQSLGVGPQPGKPLLDAMLPATLQPNLYFPDGQKQGEVYIYGSFAQSKMYHAGVTCLDCHQPHTTQVRIQGNGLCLRCHNPNPPKRFSGLQGKSYDASSHYHHKPGSAGAQCINCHMPTRTYMGVDVRRDHFFRIPRPELDIKTASPDACTSCHTGKTPGWASAAINTWFPRRDRTLGYGETLQAARLGLPGVVDQLSALLTDTRKPAMARATAAQSLTDLDLPEPPPAMVKALHDSSALVRSYSIPVFSMGAPAERIKHLLPLLDDPVLSVRDAAVSAMADIPVADFPKARRTSYVKSLQDYERRLRGNADFPGNRLNLAVLLQREGRLDEALDQYRHALKIDSYFSPARVNLVLLDNQAGREDEAEQLLREGVALKGLPETDRGQLAYMLALLLVQQGHNGEALHWMDIAARALPARPRIRYNQGLLLLQMGQRKKSQKVLESGLATAKDNPDLLYALIYLHASAGERSSAQAYLRRLEQVAPDDPRLSQLKKNLTPEQ